MHTNRTIRRGFNPRFTAVTASTVIAACILSAIAISARSQQIFIERNGGMVQRFGGPLPAEKSEKKDDLAADGDNPFPESSTLPTDPDVDRLMHQAQEFTDQKKFDVAVALWQKVLDGGQSTLMTKNSRAWNHRPDPEKVEKWLQLFRSARPEVERVLATLPPEGLREYRLTADPEARGLVASAVGDREEAALREVVARYFVSSVGDDAAFRLGSVLLDRQDFLGASRLFESILAVHPDPDVSEAETLLRLAVCASRLGDGRQTAATLARLRELDQRNAIDVSPTIVAMVAADVQQPWDESTLAGIAPGDWPMAFGNPSRTGRMRAPPDKLFSGVLTPAWTYQDELQAPVAASLAQSTSGAPIPNIGRARLRIVANRALRAATSSTGSSASGPPQTTSRADVVAQWRRNGWLPTNAALLQDGRLFIHGYHEVVCLDASTLDSDHPKVEWRVSTLAAPEQFERDLMIWQRISMQLYSYGMAAQGKFNRPYDFQGVSQFGDRILPSMVVADGGLYFIEGVPAMRLPVDPRQIGLQIEARGQRLTAVDAGDGQSGGGKFRWQWPKPTDKDDELNSIRFLGAPVPFDQTLIVSVHDRQALWLYALAPVRLPGENSWEVDVAWKLKLCDDPPTNFNPWSPVGTALHGSDLYVSSGRGVVFSVDAAAGSIRWAARYHRDVVDDASAMNNRFAHSRRTPVNLADGWIENSVLVDGRTLAVMAADRDGIWFLDRRNGDFIADAPREDATYCLGINNHRLYVAGRRLVRCFDVAQQGKMVWEYLLDESAADAEGSTMTGSYGRGALTDDAIYVPVKDAILKIALARSENQRLAEAIVRLPDENEPVGNLFFDGSSIFALGPERVYALRNLAQQLKRLDDQIAAGKLERLDDRMRLYARVERFDEAAADMKRWIESTKVDDDRTARLSIMLDALEETKLAVHRPKIALEVLLSERATIAKLSDEDRERLLDDNRLPNLLFDIYTAIVAQKTPRAGGAVLDAIGAFPPVEPSTLARDALRATVVAADVDRLKRAIDQGPEPLRRAAVVALGGLPRNVAQAPLLALVRSSNETTRLAAAESLTQWGDRRALAPLVEMLDVDSFDSRFGAIRALQASTGERFDFLAHHQSPDKRQKSVIEWRKWLREKGATAALNVPPRTVPYHVGRILVAFGSSTPGAGAVELDFDGKPIWKASDVAKLQISGAGVCIGSPDGSRLFAMPASRQVHYVNPQGDFEWVSPQLSIMPRYLERLDGGRTFVFGSRADDPSRSAKMITLGPTGQVETQRELTSPGVILDCSRAVDGSLLIVVSGSNAIHRIDRSGAIGQQAWTAPDGNSTPYCVKALPNGNFLVGCRNTRSRVTQQRVVVAGNRRIAKSTTGNLSSLTEYDVKGDATWRLTVGDSPLNIVSVARLPGGDTLVLESDRLRRINARGEVVWTYDDISNGAKLSVY